MAKRFPSIYRRPVDRPTRGDDPPPAPGWSFLGALDRVGDAVRSVVGSVPGATSGRGPGYDAFKRAGALPAPAPTLADRFSTLLRTRPTAGSDGAVGRAEPTSNQFLLAERRRQVRGMTPLGGSRVPKPKR